MRRALVWIVIAGAGGLVALTIAPPLLGAAGLEEASAVARLMLSPLCHQDPGRSLPLAGRVLGTCARCSAIHAAFFLTALAAAPRLLKLPPSTRPPFPPRSWMIASLLPMALQWGAARMAFPGAWIDGNLPRALSGALFGAGLALFIVPAVVEMAFEMGRARRSPARQERRNVPAA